MFESPCGLAFLNDETVQQLLPLDNFPGRLGSSGSYGSTSLVGAEEGCWEGDRH